MQAMFYRHDVGLKPPQELWQATDLLLDTTPEVAPRTRQISKRNLSGNIHRDRTHQSPAEKDRLRDNLAVGSRCDHTATAQSDRHTDSSAQVSRRSGMRSQVSSMGAESEHSLALSAATAESAALQPGQGLYGFQAPTEHGSLSTSMIARLGPR